VPFTLVHAEKYTENTETKHNPQKENNAKQQNKTNLRQSARKRDGLTLQCTRAHTFDGKIWF